MDNVKFVLGDFCKFLEKPSEFFDFIIASGVLYHLKNPIQILELILSQTKHVLIWTHYYDELLIDSNEDQKRKIIPQDDFEYSGKKYSTVSYSYNESKEWDGFCGGMNDSATWYEKNL